MFNPQTVCLFACFALLRTSVGVEQSSVEN